MTRTWYVLVATAARRLYPHDRLHALVERLRPSNDDFDFSYLSYSASARAGITGQQKPLTV